MATKNVKEDYIRFRLRKDLKDKLKKMCEDKKVTMSKWISLIIENEIERYEFNLKNSDSIEKRIVATDEKLSKLRDKLK